MLIRDLGLSLVLLVEMVLLLLLGKVAFDLLARLRQGYNADQELAVRNNPALGAVLLGYLVGLAYALIGTLVSPDAGFWTDVGVVAEYGLLAIALLLLSGIVNDKAILYAFDNKKEIIEDRNLGVGIVEGASYLATAFIFVGAHSTPESGLLRPLLWFVLGQAALVLSGLCYQRLLPYSVQREIEDNNTACAVGFAGVLLAIGLIVQKTISGPSTTWADDLQGAGLYLLLGLILLALARFATDLILLPTVRLNREIVEDRNVGAALLEAAASLGVAMLLTFVM